MTPATLDAAAPAATAARQSYYGLRAGRPVSLPDPKVPVDLFASAAVSAFAGFVQNPQFSCVGAKSAVAHETIRFGAYDRLGSPESAAELARDLVRFAEEPAELRDTDFVSFAAIFRTPADLDEAGFERALWAELRQLHAIDAATSDWSPAVSRDPADPHFGFSVAGAPFFVVGLHPNSSRDARRFPFPTLVFNPHAQFARLKAEGGWARLQHVIRSRELKLQGSLNPNLADYGSASEARQYSGRSVEADWQPPFEAVAPAAKSPAGRCPFAHLHGKSPGGAA